uniref:Uncharacterized protein n=1 Tax=Caenorhabditis japonica TaxID=281687 RepID=A0A8R1HIP6_CAEJA
MIFDIIHYHTGQRTVEALWQLVIVDNSVEIDRFDDEEEKKRTELPEGGELDGRGDAGKDFQHKKPPKTPTNREFETGKLAESLTHLLGSQSSFESHSHGSSSESQDGPLLS